MAIRRHTISGLVLIYLTGFSSFYGKETPPVQPVQFNHKFHIDEQDLTCTDCHVQVETQRQASIPNISICSDCHEDMDTDIAEAQKVVDYIASNTRIPWVQIHRVPDHAYFSHRRHVAIGNLECSKCHGEVANKTTPFDQPFTKMDMDWCKNCHKASLVSLDCNSCHR